MRYRHEIDGIRAIAVLSVIIAHTGLGVLPGGFIGVDIFFVISGFLITGIILRDLEQERFRFRDFYARRARRIFPALFFMLAVACVVAWLVMTPSDIQDFSASVFFSVLFLSNGYFLDFTDYFAPSAHFIPLLHTWSLAIEEQFYVLFPLFAWAAYRGFGLTGLWVAVVVMLMASFALSEWGWRNKPDANYFFSPSRFWEILLGAVGALWSARRQVQSNEPLAVAGLIAIGASLFLFDETTPIPSVYALVPTLGTLALLLYARDESVVARMLRTYPLRILGLISFSAYLWHQPIFVFSRILGVETSGWGVAIGLIALVLVASGLSWRFVEQPFRVSHVPGSGLPWWRGGVLSVTAVALIGVSLVGYLTELPLARYDEADRRLLSVTRDSADDYQSHVGRPFERRSFESDGAAPKVAFVGDSFSRDFMNVLEEAGILSDLDVSYWIISRKCAPFFLPPDDLRLREIWDVPDCLDYDRYRSAEMLDVLSKADVVVLSSAWLEWHVPFVRETVLNIGLVSSARVVLVGPKMFGPVRARTLLRLPSDQRPLYRIDIGQEILDTNIALSGIDGVTFIDMIAAVCDLGGQCPQVDQGGYLISQDGGHLTPVGADLMARALGGRAELMALFATAYE